jgi:protein-L-isoaspartate(D-aspartate) O-methyltransferase
LEQLKEDGRILLPLSINGPQLSVAFDRQNNHLVSASVKPCGFMRIRGESAEPQNEHQLGLDPGLSLEFYTSLGAVDPGEVYQWLTESYQDWSTNVTTTPSQIFCSLLLWLSLNEPRKCSLIAHGDAVEKALVPFLFGDFSDNQWRATVAVMMEDGLGALMRPPDTQIPPPPPEPGEPSPPFAIFVRSFGPNDAAANG